MDTKPGLSPEMLKMARTSLALVWVIALAVIANDKAMTALGLLDYRELLSTIFGLLAGKEVLPRLGDVSPTKLQLEVERATSRPPSMSPPAAGG
jgi:hypothetical protein